MPPTNGGRTATEVVEDYIKDNNVMIFSKSTCPFCVKVTELLDSLKVQYTMLQMDKDDKMVELQAALYKRSGQKTVPNVYVKGQHLGGCDDTMQAYTEGRLLDMIATHKYEYDLVVLGGGSGGLAASKLAATLGRKVAVCDFVKPTPTNTTWGLGGTCVNVGCIPKKLMHQAALLGKGLVDAQKYGWGAKMDGKLDWNLLVRGVQDYIGSLNWGYRVQLREKKVNYVNAYAEFIDAHTIEATNTRGKKQQLTAEKFIIAVGERPKYPQIPGAVEYGITSDDIFSLSYNPGKTLVIGASYVALECAGFLQGIGVDTTVMVRSILLRGFDQQIAEKIGQYMAAEGCKFIRPATPSKIECIRAAKEEQAGLLRVFSQSGETQLVEEYNTVSNVFFKTHINYF